MHQVGVVYPTRIYHARDAEKFALVSIMIHMDFDNLSNLAHAHCCAQATNNLCTSHNNEYELKFVLSAALYSNIMLPRYTVLST